MQIPTFVLERSQTLYENDVAINLTESGVHPAAISDILSGAELAELAALPLGYGYTDGTPSLRQSVADWYPGAASENVLVAHGSSEANLLTLMALAERGDHVIVVVPNFMQIAGLANSLGIEVTQVALRPSDGWQPDISALEAAIGPRTKLITLCDPNNPTGTTLTQSSRRALSELSDRTGVWLHVDEIYRGSEIDAIDAPTIYGMGKRVIVTGGLAKSFGCPGLRMGWMIGPQALVAEGHRFQDYTSIGTGVVSQFIAERALREPVRSILLSRGRDILAAGRQRWPNGSTGVRAGLGSYRKRAAWRFFATIWTSRRRASWKGCAGARACSFARAAGSASRATSVSASASIRIISKADWLISPTICARNGRSIDRHRSSLRFGFAP
ncbi:MAG: aminotransferase class I/II-fold pyridoxal phosphate-dependent enzyme [Mesorhizobium sp.]